MPRILIADDHDIVRQMLVRMLQEIFPDVLIEEAADTATLVQKALDADWDAILSDLSMPGGGGITALHQIRVVKPILPFIIISTHPSDPYEAYSLKAGADYYINKDDVFSQLPPLLRQIL